MPNNLVFNNVASQLKTQLYAQYNEDVIALKADSLGDLLIAGTVNIGNTLTVQGTVYVGDTVTVQGTVNVGNTVPISGTVNIGNTVPVTGTVNVENTVPVSGAITAYTTMAYTENNVTITAGTGTSVTLTFDNSQFSLLSYYVKNNATNTITVRLQISPTLNDAYFTNDEIDPTFVAPASIVVLVPKYYLRFTRLYYDTGTYTADIEAYYNART